jgi:hypothetical protein
VVSLSPVASLVVLADVVDAEVVGSPSPVVAVLVEPSPLPLSVSPPGVLGPHAASPDKIHA